MSTTTKPRARRSRASASETNSSVPSIKVTDNTIDELAKVFKMLSDPQRLKILLALAQEGEMSVTALKDLLNQSQPAVSHHLTLMRMTGIVGFDRKGKNNFYYLNSEKLRDLLEAFFADSGNGQKQLSFDEFLLSYKRR